MNKIKLTILIVVNGIIPISAKEINLEAFAIKSNLAKCESKEFRDNCISLEELPDGTIYYGEFSKNKRDGYGIALFNDESSFEGAFANGWRLNGIQKYKNGDIYTGSYKYGKLDGEGILLLSNGTLYTGQFKDGKYHGKGQLQYANGEIYDGNFESGEYSKHGKLKFNNGEFYFGNFENGHASGFGEYQFKDGSKYIGNFHRGRFSGYGVELLGEQIISRQGIWENGELIKADITKIDEIQNISNIKSKSEIQILNSNIRDAFRSLRNNEDFASAENYASTLHDATEATLDSESNDASEFINKLTNLKHLLPNDSLREVKKIIISGTINDIQRMPPEELKANSEYLKNNYPVGHYFRALSDYYEFLYTAWTTPAKVAEYAKHFLNENSIRAIAFVEGSEYEISKNICRYRAKAFTSYFSMSGLEKDSIQLEKIEKRAKYALELMNSCSNLNKNEKRSFLYSVQQYLRNPNEALLANSLLTDLMEQTALETISIKNSRGHILRKARKFDEAEIEFLESIKIAKANQFQYWVSDLEISLSILFIDQEKFNRAEELLVKNLAQANADGYSNWYKCHILSYLARSQEYQGKISNAITILKSCINMANNDRKEMVNSSQISDKTFYANGWFGSFYEYLAQLLISIDRLSEASQVLDLLKEEEYFEFIRRSNVADPGRTPPLAYTATEQTWVTRYRQIADQLAALGAEEQDLQKQAKLGLTTKQKQRQQAVTKDLVVARKAFESFLNELRDSFAKQGPARAAEVMETSQQPLRDTQKLLKGLGNDTVLLQYYVTDDKVGMLLTTSGVQLARTTPVKSKELTRQIVEFRRLLRDPKANTLLAAQALYQLLLAPVEKDLEQAGAKNIMLSLDGSLRYLPFAALHDGKQHLVQRWNMPIYTSVAKNKLRDAVTPQWQVAGLGLTRAVGEFSALPAVKAEMSSIVRTGTTGVLPGEVYLDEAFNAARFKDVSQRKFQLLHVASHFQFSPGTEINSFLLLGDGQQLTLGDIRTQNYRFDNVDLSTLSACDTGLGGGRDAQGREIEGFGVIAQQQGAKAVLATLWPVADQSTAVLMADMYKQRQEKSLTKVEALRQAQLSLLSQPKYSHPFYWAPFILMGNWK